MTKKCEVTLRENEMWTCQSNAETSVYVDILFGYEHYFVFMAVTFCMWYYMLRKHREKFNVRLFGTEWNAKQTFHYQALKNRISLTLEDEFYSLLFKQSLKFFGIN